MDYKKELSDYKKNNKVFVLKSLFEDLPSWESVLDQLNYSIKLVGEDLGNKGSKEIVGAVNFWNRLTLTVERPSSEYIKEIDNFISKLDNIYPGHCGHFLIISFTDSEPTTGKHNDPVDVIYVQCIGKVVWNIYDNKIHSRYELNPGDAIFVPAGIDHEIESLGPRMATSFMFKGENNE